MRNDVVIRAFAFTYFETQGRLRVTYYCSEPTLMTGQLDPERRSAAGSTLRVQHCSLP
jgi:hypothetical protein